MRQNHSRSTVSSSTSLDTESQLAWSGWTPLPMSETMGAVIVAGQGHAQGKQCTRNVIAAGR